MLWLNFVDANLQNVYYEGYTCIVNVSNILVFTFFGEIIYDGIIFLESWHDSKVLLVFGLLLERLGDEKNPRERAILGTSAIVAKVYVIQGRIMRVRNLAKAMSIFTYMLLVSVVAILQGVVTSEQEGEEWMVNALKEPFGRFSFPLLANASMRYRRFSVRLHLYNPRLREIGFNWAMILHGSCM